MDRLHMEYCQSQELEQMIWLTVYIAVNSAFIIVHIFH